MQIAVVSILPEMIESISEYGVVGRALERRLATIRCVNPRDFATDAHRTVDDRPYGGGPGMVLKFEPTAAAIRDARRIMPEGSPVICLTPQGAVFDQAVAERLADMAGIVLLAGRYEGIDERIIEAEVDEEISLGDFVLSGGEIAALAVIDAVVRLLPGALGDPESAVQESYAEGLLDCPHYTRPEVVENRRVPQVLLSGDHAKIARWRRKQALGRSFLRRPDLVRKLRLDSEQQALLDEFLEEREHGAGR